MTKEDAIEQARDILKNNKSYIHIFINTLNPDLITDELIIMCINAGCENMLGFIKNQTEEICIKAVRNNAADLLKVREQTYLICLEAAKHAKINQGHLLGAVINQNATICTHFIQADPHAIAYVRQQTKDLCELAIDLDSCVLPYIRNQTEQICIDAVNQYPYTIRYVEDVTDDIRKVYKQCSRR